MTIERNIIWPGAGKYIIAVSGGVDSLVLLDMLMQSSKSKKYQLLVAHFDHGIRKDSKADRDFVRSLAEKYGFQFESKSARLGSEASEATARQARYEFLENIKEKHGADAIITAHHLDDRIETAIFNLQRGTGRRGLVPFSRVDILRPLKNVYRADIIEYAELHKLTWREDPTNTDLRYSRNEIRHKFIPTLEQSDPEFKTKFAKVLHELEAEHKLIEDLLTKKLRKIGHESAGRVVLKRNELISMPLITLKELLYFAILQLKPDAEIAKLQLARLAHFCKTALPGKVCPISGGLSAKALQREIILG